MSNRVINAIGLVLGAALVGLPIGVHHARKLRMPVAGEVYSQAVAVTNVQTKLRGGRR